MTNTLRQFSLIFRITSALFFICALSGCHVTHPSDLKLVATHVVSLSDLPGLWAWGQKRTDVAQNKIRLLRVTFSSKVDLVKFAKSNSYIVSYNLTRCDLSGGMSDAAVFSIPYVRLGAESIESGIGFSRPDIESRRKDGMFNYDFFIPLENDELRHVYGKGVSISGKTVPLYNYSNVPGDLCFELVGGRFGGIGTFNSNIIRIPRAEIIHAAEFEGAGAPN